MARVKGVQRPLCIDEGHDMPIKLKHPQSIDGYQQSQCMVLVVGFAHAQAHHIAEALGVVNWRTLVAQDGDDAVSKAQVTPFDFILIETDGVDLFAPIVIEAVRLPSSASQRSTIVAFGQYLLPAFRERLVACGADGFCALPVDTASLIPSLTTASVSRMKSTASNLNTHCGASPQNNRDNDV
ncbi:MAG: hypothetical protein AAFP16_03660 [Pseudomonadota bacterium]